MKIKLFVPVLLGVMLSLPVQAADVLNTKLMTLDLARDIANHTLNDCRKKGYNTAVVVVIEQVIRRLYCAMYTYPAMPSKSPNAKQVLL